ncbi:MAG TPA: hypothetical protein DCP69_07580 [Candidatus Omnitrophica bacterium]|nr:hypothetical protein [Candidatus Omnitrophota bacterium]
MNRIQAYVKMTLQVGNRMLEIGLGENRELDAPPDILPSERALLVEQLQKEVELLLRGGFEPRPTKSSPPSRRPAPPEDTGFKEVTPSNPTLTGFAGATPVNTGLPAANPSNPASLPVAPERAKELLTNLAQEMAERKNARPTTPVAGTLEGSAEREDTTRKALSNLTELLNTEKKNTRTRR